MNTENWFWLTFDFVMITSIISAFFVLRSRKIDYEIRNELMELPSSDEVKMIHRDHAYADRSLSNPNRTIAEAMSLLSQDASSFDKSIALSSAYYGQVSHLIVDRRYVDAVIFFMRAWNHAERALAYTKKETTQLSASQLEVLYARYYMLAVKLPFIGRALFGGKAIASLEQARERCDLSARVTKGIILGKLYDVSRKSSYKYNLRNIGLTKDDDPKDVRRIARSVGMTLEELYSFLDI